MRHNNVIKIHIGVFNKKVNLELILIGMEEQLNLDPVISELECLDI